MSLRPRYSLLTLLVLTAFVAGGVKFWYGPHHVLQRVANGRELEYSFTRDWRGQRIVHGPCILRILESDGSVNFIHITYIRHGEALPCHYSLQKQERVNTRLLEGVFNDESFAKLLLEQVEREEFLQAIETERRRKKHSSVYWFWYEDVHGGPLNLDFDFVDFGDLDEVAEILARANE